MRTALQISKQSFSSSLKQIYQHESIHERIKHFRQIEWTDHCQSLPVLHTPSFLREETAKSILQFVQQNKIGNNVRIVHALTHI